MRRGLCIGAVIWGWVIAAPALADGVVGSPCKFGIEVRETCGDYGCIVEAEAGPSTHRAQIGAAGRCGPCSDDSECGGVKCDRNSSTCKRQIQDPIAPESLRPTFHLAVADISLPLGPGEGKPIIGAGYVFQVALSRTHPQPRPGGGWITPDPPSWYGNLGVSAAFAGERQNLFLDGGLTYYSPGMPLYLTTLGVGALYQRQGEELWDLGDEENNMDRLGPALTLGFLQNAYVRLSYGFPLRGDDDGTWLLSLIYMRDLAKDVLPDRFRKFIAR